MNLKFVLYVLLMFLFNTSLAVMFTTEIKLHSDNNFDITTLIKLHENTIDTPMTCPRPDKSLDNIINNLSDCYDGEIHLRNNAVGMPIYFNGRVLSLKENALEFIVDSYYPNKYITKNHVEFESNWWDIITHFNSIYGNTITAAGGLLQTNTYYDNNLSHPFNISWTPDATMKGCISLTYVSMSSYGPYVPDVYLNIYEKENSSPMISYTMLGSYNTSLKTLILRTNELFLRKKTYYLVITTEHVKYERFFGLKRIAQCNGKEEVYKISENEIKDSVLRSHSANTYHLDASESAASTLFYEECNQNEFGADCSGTCSTRGTFCERMLFCTSRDGCSCATGYTGQFCEQKCPRGTYGRDCQQICSVNCNSCDIHTGFCKGRCENLFILPYCTEKYPWLITPPQLVSSDYHSVRLNVSFEIENIAGSQQKTPIYYQIVYKQASSNSDFDNFDVKEIGDFNYSTVNIDNLLSGTEYTFGTVVITDDGNFNDEDINTANYTTQCLIPKNIDYGIHLAKCATCINVTWEKYIKKSIFECEIVNYTLKLIFDQNQNFYEVAYTSSNKYDFDNLISAHTYAVQVTAMTTLGPTEPSELFYKSTDVQGFISIRNITAELTDLQSHAVLHLKWKLNNAYTNALMSYMIKYKINRHYGCSRQTANGNWSTIIIENKTECMLDLIHHTQYMVKVEPITTGYTYGESENVIFVRTTTSIPSLAPVLDVSRPMYVTNQSALIKWYVDKEKCNKLHGIVTGFHVILNNLKDGKEIIKEIEEPAVKYTNLIPNTEYELQVYIKTDQGFNENYMLSVPFKTKPKFLLPVEELSVYKKNSKSTEIGLRWSYPNDTDMDGFIIQVNHPISKKTNVNQTTIEPLRCKAWPTMYCTTVHYLTRRAQYTINILPKSVDYPSGILPVSITFNTMDETPDGPKNVKAIQVGAKNVTIEWDVPWMFNGVLNSFIINVEEVSSVDVDSCCASFPAMELQVTEELPTYNYTINDLKPGSTYTIGVSSKTSWHSQASQIHVTTLSDTTANIPSEVSENNSTETN